MEGGDVIIREIVLGRRGGSNNWWTPSLAELYFEKEKQILEYLLHFFIIINLFIFGVAQGRPLSASEGSSRGG